VPAWLDNPVHVLDFEGSRRTGIVEYGVVTLLGGAIVTTSTRLCRPRSGLTAEDVRLHGIRQAEAASQPPFSDEWERFNAMRASGPFAAHHAPVESGLIRQVWPVSRRSVDFSRGDEGAVSSAWGPWLDTRRLYERLYPGLESYKLAGLCRAFGLDAEIGELARQHCPSGRGKWHCALYDALASALLLLRLEREEAELRGVSLEWLLQVAAPSEEGRERIRQGELFLE
jgi:DNA polymerase-3 subunit epsilon